MKRTDLRKRYKPFEGKRVAVSYLWDCEIKTATGVVTHVGWDTVWLKTKYEIAELGRAASIDIPSACIIAIACLGDEVK